MFLESRTEKTEYAMNFVQNLRQEGIRFLKKDDKDGKKWSDVGDQKMREKVSQNLREHQPKLKKQLAQQQQMQQQSQQHQMPMPNLNQQSSNFSIGSNSSQQQMPALNAGVSPLQQQRPFVDQQALLQQQQFYQMQAMAQQNQLQSQQQFQQLLQQQQQMANNAQFPGFANPMMQQQVMSNPMMANSNTMMNNMNNNNMNMNNSNINSTGIAPLPFGNDMGNQWNNNSSSNDDRERNLLNMVNAGEHRMASNSAFPEQVASQQQHYNDGDLPLHNIAKPSIAQRIATLTDVDVAVAMQGDMGESTHSILDVLNVDPVPEEIDGDEFGGDSGDGDPLSSPSPNQPTINSIEQITPVVSNRPKVAARPFNDPATVTPTPSSPKQKKSSASNNCVLDNDMLAAWASTADDDDAFNEAIGGNMPGGAPFQRSYTNPGIASPKLPEGQGIRRMGTSPGPVRDPFRSTSPHPPRKTNSHGDGADLSPRPSALTLSKRGTSNVNDTPETRGHLKFQEGTLSDDFGLESDSTERTSSQSSNWSGSVKKVMKASLGRDKSAQSRLLKQQCMPYAYGPATGSFSSVSTAGTSVSTLPAMSASYNGWAANVTLNSSEEDKLTRTSSPVPDKGTTTDVTPKTQRVLHDFGKMTLTQAAEKGLSPNQGPARTARRFEETIANQAGKIPMDLMVNKPSPLQWRNRST